MPRKPTAGPGVQIGPLSNRSTNARHFVPEPLEFPPPMLICNSVMPNMTAEEGRRLAARASARPGADDHKRWRSKGAGC